MQYGGKRRWGRLTLVPDDFKGLQKIVIGDAIPPKKGSSLLLKLHYSDGSVKEKYGY